MEDEGLPDMNIVREFIHSLTKREREAFDLIGQGYANYQIAKTMGISLLTARTYAKRIHDKLYIVGRSRLAIAAHIINEEGNDARESVIG